MANIKYVAPKAKANKHMTRLRSRASLDRGTDASKKKNASVNYNEGFSQAAPGKGDSLKELSPQPAFKSKEAAEELGEEEHSSAASSTAPIAAKSVKKVSAPDPALNEAACYLDYGTNPSKMKNALVNSKENVSQSAPVKGDSLKEVSTKPASKSKEPAEESEPEDELSTAAASDSGAEESSKEDSDTDSVLNEAASVVDNDTEMDSDADSQAESDQSVEEVRNIKVPAAMARIWIQDREANSGAVVNKQVIGVRYKLYNEPRSYLLGDLKWYPQHRVTTERKKNWRMNTLKAAMTLQSITMKNKEDFESYQTWGHFAILPGDDRIDPLHEKKLAWASSIYMNCYGKAVGKVAIKEHNRAA